MGEAAFLVMGEGLIIAVVSSCVHYLTALRAVKSHVYFDKFIHR